MKLSLRNVIVLELLGALVVLAALSRTWVTATYEETGFPKVNLSLSANELSSAPNGLAIAALASALGAVATRGFYRRIVGGVIFGIGIGIIYSTVNLVNNLDKFLGIQFEQAIGREVTGWTAQTSNFALLVISAAVLIAVCGVVIAIKSFDSGMSQRYERNSDRTSELTPWQSLDLGIDPTIEPR